MLIVKCFLGFLTSVHEPSHGHLGSRPASVEAFPLHSGVLLKNWGIKDKFCFFKAPLLPAYKDKFRDEGFGFRKRGWNFRD